MFYRRKLILALLQSFNGKIGKVALQKLLFLISKQQAEPTYDFVPYHYGCYSFSANADLVAMSHKGQISNDGNCYFKVDLNNYTNKLFEADKQILRNTIKEFGKMSSQTLTKHTYLNYHYYAINSTIAKSILNKSQFDLIQKARPSSLEKVLYTIGYEGISLESYLNKLIRHDIKILIDVRNNPLSRKFGFSKNQLKSFCESLGINYIHIPEVGIQSEYRQELNSQTDYDKLFNKYRKNNLKQTISYQEQILKLVAKHHRIALTCFEADIHQCHRLSLSDAITELPNWKFEVRHI